MLIKVDIVAVDRVDGRDDGVHNNRRDETDNKADNRIEDGVFCVGDFFRVAARDHVTNSADDEHNNRDNADDAEGDVADVFKE